MKNVSLNGFHQIFQSIDFLFFEIVILTLTVFLLKSTDGSAILKNSKFLF